MAFLKNLTEAATPEYNVNPSLPEKESAAEQDSLRIVIGIMGFLLPIILWAGLWSVSGYNHTLESISHYYYTRVNTAFSVTIGILAIFLIIYKGKKKIDFILSATAGVFALFVIFFPTTNLSPICSHPDYKYAITFINPDDIYSVFHFVSAGIFLVCLALIALFRFPKDDSSNEKPSQLDKFMYRACGIVMLVSLLVTAMGNFGIILNEKYFEYPYSGTFWGETVAVWAFGYSWLLKAGFFKKSRDFLFR
ncbi:hypothetical protein LXM25_16380 [Dyadobacter sp. LJ53]|uniref:hypothetical protein n=1 Tax=Dyadobacter chenwenxiniae TaxID=2906456 RepID=UPI001F358CAE|nr:hypothetical protein [Dyadobacter chenwenxiniae]MCF0051647.1 hypothetical protein [Dyadobacter chenwenxiniae]